MRSCLLFLLTFPMVAAAEEAIDILRRAAETYQAARSFEISGTISTTIQNGAYRYTAGVEFAQAGPEFIGIAQSLSIP